MVCIAVALARILPVVGSIMRLTEYGSANGETVNRHKHLGLGRGGSLATGGAFPGCSRCRDGGRPCPAVGDR